jgi:hypothetical protein
VAITANILNIGAFAFLLLQPQAGGNSGLWAGLISRAVHKEDIPRGLASVIDDITDERAAAEALRNAKEAARIITVRSTRSRNLIIPPPLPRS